MSRLGGMMDRAFLPFAMISDHHHESTLYRVQGERYFTCRPNYGVFVRSDRLRVGDFPVEEVNFDDEEM